MTETENKRQLIATTGSWNVYLEEPGYVSKMLKGNINAKKASGIKTTLEQMNKDFELLQQPNWQNRAYFLGKALRGYKTLWVPGESLVDFKKSHNLNLRDWVYIFQLLYDKVSLPHQKGYVFPDLGTDGNVLYDDKKGEIHLIDLDGVQYMTAGLGCYSNLLGDLRHVLLRNSIAFTPKYCYSENGDLKYFFPDVTVLGYFSYFIHLIFDEDLIMKSLHGNEDDSQIERVMLFLKYWFIPRR